MYNMFRTYVSNDKVRILDCGHMYHYNCINKWIEKR